MSTLLITRAHKLLLIGIAGLLIASLLAPVIALAGSDLAVGDTAVVNNPNGDGANLRSTTSAADDSTIIAILDQGSYVVVTSGPIYNEAGTWVEVSTIFGYGYVVTSLLDKVESDGEINHTSSDETEAAPVSSGLAWLDPIDSATVVDSAGELPEDGLAVRSDATTDSIILGYAPVGTTLGVTSDRVWTGDTPYVRVNFNGEGAYVNAWYVALESEFVAPEPVVTEEIIWIEDDVEEPVAEETVVTDSVPEDGTEENGYAASLPEGEDDTEVAASATDDGADAANSEDATAEDGDVALAADDNASPDEDAVETPDTEVIDESAEDADEVGTPAEEVATDSDGTDAPDEESTATEEAVTDDDSADDAGAPEAEPTDDPESESTDEGVVETPVESTGPAATTVNEFDVNTMIGSATVTGTLNGLLCRADADPSAAVIMTLAEGTKVLVNAEPVNGYLGIDCGGLQGFADVNYLWSGGALDKEISAAKMNVVVTGTGSSLNCRTGAGLSYGVITSIKDGTVLVTRGKASNGWTPVVCGGQNGFVSTTWIEVQAGSTSDTPTNTTTTTGTATVNTGGDGLYCRSGAGTTYGIITVLKNGATVPVRGAQQGDWVPVNCGGLDGFAHGSYLTLGTTSTPSTPTTPEPGNDSTANGTVTVANTGGQGLNCRSGAGTGHSVVTVLRLGQSVQTRSGSTSGWTAVTCGGFNGFVSSEFVTGSSGGGNTPTEDTKPTTPTEESKPATPNGFANNDHAKATARVNFRYNPSLSSGVALVLDQGLVVLVTGSINGEFYPVDYDGLAGFVHKDFLAKTTDALSKRGGSSTDTPTVPDTPASNETSTPRGEAIVAYAMRYLGYPYVWATHGPASFDCSGFTYWVIQNVIGKNIGYGTWTQVAAGQSVSRNSLQPGDLVFFQNTYTAGLSHVGIYIGNNQFVHSANEDTGVIISDLTSSYYASRWYGATRI